MGSPPICGSTRKATSPRSEPTALQPKRGPMTNPAATFRVDGASSGTAPISALGGSATESPSTPVET